jgi:hypothetical protein
MIERVAQALQRLFEFLEQTKIKAMQNHQEHQPASNFLVFFWRY